MFTNRNFKTVAYRDWERFLLYELGKKEVQEQLDKIRQNFDSKKHGLVVKFDFYYPYNIIYTAEGKLSSKAFDLSNVEKPLLDLIFLVKHEDSGSLSIDDKFVLSLQSRKRVSATGAFYTRISLKIVPIELGP